MAFPASQVLRKPGDEAVNSYHVVLGINHQTIDQVRANKASALSRAISTHSIGAGQQVRDFEA
jgi:hypothetical protein